MISSVALFECFEKEARRRPARSILRIQGTTRDTTAAGLLDDTVRISRTMRRSGLREGGVALLDHVEGESLIAAILGTWSLGAAVLVIEKGAPAGEADRFRALFAPRILVSPGAAGALAVESIAAGEGPRLPPGCAVIKLTSGSTGSPRGIAVTASQLAADTRRLIRAMRIGRDTINLAAISLSHSYGLSVLVMPLVLQVSPLLLVPSPLPDRLAAALTSGMSVAFPGVPYLFEMLLRHGDASAGSVPETVRCISAGAPLSPGTAREFRARFGIPIRVFYGTSETGGISYDASDEGAAAMTEGCVGTPLPGVTVSTEGRARRIVVRSSAVASGYLGPDAGESAPTGGRFEGRRFLTGDTGRIDGKGLLRLTGRLGVLVNVSGRKVNPREVETTLRSIEGIEQAAVLAEPDAARGHALVACLVAERSLTRERVMAQLHRRLAAYKLPRRFVFMDRLPVNTRGKLDEATLRREVLRKR